MAALISVIAGRFSATYTPPAGSPGDLGITDDPGYRLGFTPEFDEVKDTDAYGAAVIEMVTLGFSNVSLAFTTKEWKTATLLALNPFSTYAASGATTFKPGAVGRAATALAGSVILTATSGTLAAAAPATLTATYAIISKGFRAEWVLGPRHRKIPFQFTLLPYSNTGAEFFAST
jgi:hypothetical protein